MPYTHFRIGSLVPAIPNTPESNAIWPEDCDAPFSVYHKSAPVIDFSNTGINIIYIFYIQKCDVYFFTLIRDSQKATPIPDTLPAIFYSVPWHLARIF